MLLIVETLRAEKYLGEMPWAKYQLIFIADGYDIKASHVYKCMT